MLNDRGQTSSTKGPWAANWEEPKGRAANEEFRLVMQPGYRDKHIFHLMCLGSGGLSYPDLLGPRRARADGGRCPFGLRGFAQQPQGLTPGLTDTCPHWLPPGPHDKDPNHHMFQTDGFLFLFGLMLNTLDVRSY